MESNVTALVETRIRRLPAQRVLMPDGTVQKTRQVFIITLVGHGPGNAYFADPLFYSLREAQAWCHATYPRVPCLYTGTME
jgi:hypothetical protein